MSSRILPYKYDLSAGISTVLIIIVGNFVDKGNNLVLKFSGLSLFVLSIIFWIAPIFSLKKYGYADKGEKYFETHSVVNNGIYSLIRHPQYLAYMLLVLGFAFIYQSWITYIIAVSAIVLFYIHTIEEEKEMLENYSQNYKDYCENVPRFNIIKSSLKIYTKKRSPTKQ